ncbi:MAG TPA: hypothetical protein VIE66_08010 [Methylocella sp.]|jgi:hypothetical protein
MRRLLAGSAIATLIVTHALANGTTAQPLSRFLESLGTGGNIYRGTPTRDSLVAYLGFKAFRDGLVKDATGVANAIALYQATGAKTIIMANAGPSYPTLAQFIGFAEQLKAAGALLALEGPNEPGNFNLTYKGHTGGYGGADWLPVAQFQADLYAAVKADPLLAGIPVFAPSEVGAETGNYGLQVNQLAPGIGDPDKLAAAGFSPTQAFADYANVHNYVCGVHPDPIPPNRAWLTASVTDNVAGIDGFYGNNIITWAKKYPGYTVAQGPTVPKVTTETGLQTAETAAGGSVTEDAQGKLLMSLMLDQFKLGWDYTIQYQLYDTPGTTWGLFRADKTPKLGATYFHNLTAILASSGPPPAIGQLPYGYLGTPPETVHDLLLQREDGRLFLAVWDENPPGTGSDSVSIDLGKEFLSVSVYDPTIGVQPQSTFSDVRIVPLSLTDHAVILELN